MASYHPHPRIQFGAGSNFPPSRSYHPHPNLPPSRGKGLIQRFPKTHCIRQQPNWNLRKIREVLIHGKYLSQKDIEICIACDISALGDDNREAIEALHNALCESYGFVYTGSCRGTGKI